VFCARSFASRPTAKATTVVDRYQGKRFNSPNDVVLGPDGAIYFTDPTSDLPKDQKQEIPFKGVYRIAADGQLQLLTKDLEDPNGLAFSPDGTKFYVDDSTQRNIHVYDFKWPSEQRTNLRRRAGRQNDGVPDGMKVDRQGNLYVVGPKGNMGLGSGWPSSGNDCGAGAACESCLGRLRLLHPLHHRDHFCV
jgi:gluconolactonase